MTELIAEAGCFAGASKDEQSVGTTLNQVLKKLFKGSAVQGVAIEQRSKNRWNNAADWAGDSGHKKCLGTATNDIEYRGG